MEYLIAIANQIRNSGLFLYIKVSFYKRTADSAHSDVIYNAKKINYISHSDVIYEIKLLKRKDEFYESYKENENKT